MSKMEKWADKLPFGFEQFIQGLSYKTRLAIASLLLEKNDMRFIEIQKELEIPKNSLSQHLTKMADEGIIQRRRFYWDSEEKFYNSYYSLYPIHRELINSIKKKLEIHNIPTIDKAESYHSNIRYYQNNPFLLQDQGKVVFGKIRVSLVGAQE